MARIPKPWFRKDRQAYFVTINSTRHNLGHNKKETDRRFHELMATAGETPQPATLSETARRPAATLEPLTVAELFENSLEWGQKHRSLRPA